MRRRRPRPTPVPVKPFAEAEARATALERAVAYRTVTCDFTLADAARWTWPEHVIEALTKAYPYVSHTRFDSTANEGDLCVPGLGAIIRLHYDLGQIAMCGPVAGLSSILTACLSTDGNPLGEVVKQTLAIHQQWNKVRRVIDWMNDHATVGAARFYCPPMCSLLPAYHPINTIDGQRYREPTESISAINSELREMGAIVAGALFCPPPDAEQRQGLGVQFELQGGGYSQRFMLL